MDFVFNQEIITSPHNGEIVIRRRFGVPSVFVDGYDQSTDYIRTMWRQALRHVPRRGVTSVLMLGLCAGAGVNEIHRRFRGAEVTVIDWDPVMIELFHKLNPRARPVHIIEGDAFTELPRLNSKFDVVVIDLFKGKDPAPQLMDDAAIEKIVKVLSDGGCCIVNAFATPGVIEAFDRHLMRLGKWQYRFNTYAVYRKIT